MKISIASARGPVWANEEHTVINCWLRSSLDTEEVPFSASPDDCEAHGRELFRRCASGEFGPVGPFYPNGHPRHEQFSSRSRGFVFPEPSTNPFEKWPEVNDFIKEAREENARGTLRGIGLVWGTMLEEMLMRYVRSELDKRQHKWSILKRPHGGKYGKTFANVIDLAHDQGFIDADFYHDLTSIRHVRNCCAHEWRLDFSNPAVALLWSDFVGLHTRYFPSLIIEEDLELLMKLVYAPICSLMIIHLAGKL
jgi:hypothetical protein